MGSTYGAVGKLTYKSDVDVVNATKDFIGYMSNRNTTFHDVDFTDVKGAIECIFSTQYLDIKEYTSNSIKFRSEFDGTYGWYSVMEGWFEAIASVLDNGSNLHIWDWESDGSYVGSVVDGKVTWFTLSDWQRRINKRYDDYSDAMIYDESVGISNMAERRWYVLNDLQGGDFGMNRLYTAEEWLDQVCDWSEADGTFDEDDPNWNEEAYRQRWEEVIANDPQEFIDYVSDLWELEIVEHGVDGHDYYVDIEDYDPDFYTPDDDDLFESTHVKLTLDEDFDEDIQEIGQEFTSANTSINSTKVPAVFKMVSFEPETVNLDFGGGKFDTAADYLSDYDVINLVYDPYNRSEKHNKEVIATLKEHGGADTCTCSNVLNVIKEPEVRLNVLNNIKKLLKPNGTCYITVYEGTGKGDEGETKSGYQLNRKTADYLDEIQQVFPNATRKGKLIVAKA